MSGFFAALHTAMSAGLTDDWTVYIEPGFVDSNAQTAYLSAGSKANKNFNNKTVLISTDPSDLTNLATICGGFSIGNSLGMTTGGTVIFEHLKVLSATGTTFNTGGGTVTQPMHLNVRNCLLYIDLLGYATTPATFNITVTGFSNSNFINNSVFFSSTTDTPDALTLGGGVSATHNIINNLFACYVNTDLSFLGAVTGVTATNVVNNTFWNYGAGNCVKAGTWTTDTNNLLKPTAGTDPVLNSSVIQSTSDSTTTMAGRDAKDSASSTGVYQNGADTSAYVVTGFEDHGLNTDVRGFVRSVPYDRGAYQADYTSSSSSSSYSSVSSSSSSLSSSSCSHSSCSSSSCSSSFSSSSFSSSSSCSSSCSSSFSSSSSSSCSSSCSCSSSFSSSSSSSSCSCSSSFSSSSSSSCSSSCSCSSSSCSSSFSSSSSSSSSFSSSSSSSRAGQLIFIINDYEKFFRNPIPNGVFKYVAEDTLIQNWIDRENLVFWWEKKWYSDGSTSEGPVFGSQKDSFGSLLNLIEVLRLNAPDSVPNDFSYGTAGYENLVYGSNNEQSVNLVEKDTVLLALAHTNASGSISNVIKYSAGSYRWRAVTVDWDATAPLQLIFVINDYEAFFGDPINNGVYKYVGTNLLLTNQVDRTDLIFWWEKRWLNDGTTVEAPVNGSQKDSFGSLKDLIKTLRDNV